LILNPNYQKIFTPSNNSPNRDPKKSLIFWVIRANCRRAVFDWGELKRITKFLPAPYPP